MITFTIENEARRAATALRRIERAVPMPEEGEGGVDAAVREAFLLGARCMATQLEDGPMRSSDIRAAAGLARVTCQVRALGHGRAIQAVRGRSR